MKKIIAILLVVALTATVSVAGTLAYLQSEDSDVNVMTLGNVKIEQIEQERDENGNLVDFTQAKPLYPAVYEGDKLYMVPADQQPVSAVKDWEVTPINENVLDKIVTVKNTGKSDAYVRTVIAFETDNATDNTAWNKMYQIVNRNKDTVTQSVLEYAEIDGTGWLILMYTYKAELVPGETSMPSLKQVYMTKEMTNEDVEAVDGNGNGTYDIMVLSQGVQTQGFSDADTALNTAFGELNAENVAAWFEGEEFKTPMVVYNEDDLQDALQAGRKIILGDDIVLAEAVSAADAVSIDLNGKTLTTVGMELKNGGQIENGTVTSGADTSMKPHLKVSGGNFEMNDVTVDVQHTLNANVYWTEATGIEVANATAVFNNCDIKIHNGVQARWVYSYGISINTADVTVNGGTLTATCVAGTAANGPTNPNAISSMGECSVTLKNVAVDAVYYATTVRGNLTINTTDKNVTSANIVDNDGGSHTLNYIN